MKIAIPWLVECLQKYDEEYFHQKMMDPNWDFVWDWKINHAVLYTKFMNAARKMRKRFFFDVDEVTDRVIGTLGMRAGWTIYEHERIKLWQTVNTVREEIYA